MEQNGLRKDSSAVVGFRPGWIVAGYSISINVLEERFAGSGIDWTTIDSESALPYLYICLREMMLAGLNRHGALSVTLSVRFPKNGPYLYELQTRYTDAQLELEEMLKRGYKICADIHCIDAMLSAMGGDMILREMNPVVEACEY